MVRNKPRHQLALNARPKHPGTYHYALFGCPKDGVPRSATKQHVKNTLETISRGSGLTQWWRYECVIIPDVPNERRLLVRVVIGKTIPSSHNETQLVDTILAAVPVYQVDDAKYDAEAELAFTCRTWFRDALADLRDQGVVSMGPRGEWMDIEMKALDYVERKKREGRWSGDWKGDVGVPMLDLLNGREIVN